MKILYTILFVCFLLSSYGQEYPIARSLTKNKSIRIPFSYSENLIIVEVVLEGIAPLKFIFDTGSEYSILFEKSIADFLGISYLKTLKIRGSDMTSSIEAHISEPVEINLGGVVDVRRNILVVDKDKLFMKELLGIPVDGILGTDIFRDLCLHINYKGGVLRTLPDPRKHKKLTKYKIIDSYITTNRPFVKLRLKRDKFDIIDLSFLLDTGSEIPFLVHRHALPKNSRWDVAESAVLGLGLGGFVRGQTSRFEQLRMGDLALDSVVVGVHELDSTVLDSLSEISRHGLIGNQVIRHLNPIIDFEESKIYVHKKKLKNLRIKEDISGMFLIYGDAAFREVVVLSVVKGSPAEKANVKLGDVVLKMNGTKLKNMSLSYAKKKLSSRIGKKINLEMVRNSERFRTTLILDKYIKLK